MKPENQVHGQFTYFQALIEDEYVLFNFNDKCSLHLSVTDDTLVQFYKEIDDGVDGYSPTRYEIVNFDTVESLQDLDAGKGWDTDLASNLMYKKYWA